MIGVVDSGSQGIREIAATIDNYVDTKVADASTIVATDPSIVVVNDDAVLTTLARLNIQPPILAVDAGPGLGGIPKENLEEATKHILENNYKTIPHQIVTASISGEHVTSAVFNVMLTTAEAGRISEYGVATSKPIAQFRADGVVAATPAGSYRYANAAGSPILDSDLNALSVIPVAPFAIRTDHWVVRLESPLELSVERDENDVVLLMDGETCRSIPANTTVNIRQDGVIRTINPEIGEA